MTFRSRCFSENRCKSKVVPQKSPVDSTQHELLFFSETFFQKQGNNPRDPVEEQAKMMGSIVSSTKPSRRHDTPLNKHGKLFSFIDYRAIWQGREHVPSSQYPSIHLVTMMIVQDWRIEKLYPYVTWRILIISSDVFPEMHGTSWCIVRLLRTSHQALACILVCRSWPVHMATPLTVHVLVNRSGGCYSDRWTIGCPFRWYVFWRWIPSSIIHLSTANMTGTGSHSNFLILCFEPGQVGERLYQNFVQPQLRCVGFFSVW